MRQLKSTSYYPFGMPYGHYISGLENDWKFNGKEHITDIGLSWLDYGARMYMSDIGIWNGVDPLAEIMANHSPYSYAFNNPIRFIDLLGMSPSATNEEIDPAKAAKKEIDNKNGSSLQPRIGACPSCPAGKEFDQYRSSNQNFAYDESVGVYNDVDITITASRIYDEADPGTLRMEIANSYIGDWSYKQIRGNIGELNYDDTFCDCSEFVLRVLKDSDPEIYKKLVEVDEAGNTFGSTSTIRKGIENMGDSFRKTDPKVGDLIMWEGHVEFVNTVEGQKFTTLGAGGGNGTIVPRIMGISRNGYHWLNTSYGKIEDLGSGKYLGFWTPR